MKPRMPATPEQYAEYAALRVQLKKVLDRLNLLGAEPMHHGSPQNELEEVWGSVASAYDTLGPYGIGKPHDDVEPVRPTIPVTPPVVRPRIMLRPPTQP